MAQSATVLLRMIRPLLYYGETVPRHDFCEQPQLPFEFGNTLQSKPFQAIRGPRHLALDPAFVLGKSIQTCRQPPFVDDVVGNCPYFWSHAAREATAAALCALCAVEYDGLPLGFYRDFLKQNYDEVRHACYFLEFAMKLFDEAIGLAPDSVVADQIRCFRATGTGLELPKEGTFYESFWNSSIEERIFLMHYDSEAKGIPGMIGRLSSHFCRERGDLKNALEFDIQDEIGHARIGQRWLAYLYPESAERNKQLEQAELLRGFLLLTSVAGAAGKTSTAVAEEILCERAGT
jgi:hypothetical protein